MVGCKVTSSWEKKSNFAKRFVSIKNAMITEKSKNMFFCFFTALYIAWIRLCVYKFQVILSISFDIIKTVYGNSQEWVFDILLIGCI